jgi:hypothetical protein
VTSTLPGSAHTLPPGAETRRLRAACAQVILCFAFVCVYFVGFAPGAWDSNQRSHYQLLRALGERGTAEIGPEIRDLGTHTDIAVHDGKELSNKAPGLSVAALPAYWLVRRFLPAPSSPLDWMVFYAARVLTVTLAVLVALAVFTRRALGAAAGAGPPRMLPLWIFALLFATPFLVYARSFFSHGFTAALLFLSFTLAMHDESRNRAALAGFLAAAAVATEYPVAVIVLCLAVAIALRGPSARAAAFLCGAAPPALALAWYHARYFGGVFHTPPAASESFPSLAHRGFAGVSWPSLPAVANLFVDPAHGLLYFSPFMILWPVIAIASLRRLRSEPSLLVTALGPVALLLLISGFEPPHWRGGWCLGPRYLVAGFLLVFWLLVSRLPSVARAPARLGLAASVVYGGLVVFLCGSTFWMVPYDASNPARTISAYFLRRGVVEFNLGVAGGLPPVVSLLPPLAAVAAAFAVAVRGSAIRGPLLAAAGALGLLAFAAVLAIPPSPSAIASSHRDGLAPALLPAMRPGWR